MIIGLIALGAFVLGIFLLTCGAKLISWGGKYLLIISFVGGLGYSVYLNYIQDLLTPFITEPISHVTEAPQPTQKPPEDPRTAHFKNVTQNTNVLTTNVYTAILDAQKTQILVKTSNQYEKYTYKIKADVWRDNIIGLQIKEGTYVFFNLQVPFKEE